MNNLEKFVAKLKNGSICFGAGMGINWINMTSDFGILRARPRQLLEGIRKLSNKAWH